MATKEIVIKEKIARMLDEIPAEKMVEILDFATFIREHSLPSTNLTHPPVVKAVPAKRLRQLAGMVSWGGDAMMDTERLYE